MITKAALLVFRGTHEKELLFVRPYNKPFLVLPGGKQEPNETIEAALSRELQEELQADVTNLAYRGKIEGVTPDG